jgi:uncharacterized protein YfkK (UPF0435 family)
MVLKTCKKCSKGIEQKAMKCPYCGAGQRSRFVAWVMLLTGIFAGFIFLIFIAMITENKRTSLSPLVQDENKKMEPNNKSSIVNKVTNSTQVKPIEYMFFEKHDHQSNLYQHTYHWIQARITPLKVGLYNPEQIKETLKDSVLKLRDIYPEANLMTVWFYDRENDSKNGSAFNLGMVFWIPEKSNAGMLEPEKYDYINKDNYKYVFEICKKGEFKIPSEKAYKINDFFFQTHIKNDNLSDEDLEKITEQKFKITKKQFDSLLEEVQLFSICDENKT